jgi:hypothetical protein
MYPGYRSVVVLADITVDTYFNRIANIEGQRIVVSGGEWNTCGQIVSYRKKVKMETYKLVGLGPSGVGDMQPITRNPGQRRIIQHHHTVRILGQSLQTQHAVIRLHNHIRHLLVIWKHRVSLNQFLGVPIIQPLQQKGTQSRSCTSCNRV